ncbi:hypothetical protein ACTUSX_11515 [Pantoea ananatis]|uniref:hypothetical protein n=1 Tax=Pantoea ananas TaxID=553 RepID=UPI003FA49CD2
MTTNSPNPVDVDVQALIADCQQEIESLKWKIDRTRKSGGTLVYLESCLARQEVALAALKAEPVGFCFRSDLNLMLNKIMVSGMMTVRYSGEHPLYAIPPAQLLRPVELPDYVDDLHGIGPVMSADAVVEALRQQGYEVKND